MNAYLPPPWALWAVGGVCALILTVMLGLAARKRLKTTRPAKPESAKADALTRAAALIATIVAGQGMWQFLERIIGDIPWPLRALMFAFLEIAVITSAVRARNSMRENYSAGVDGMAVWALTSVSAVLAAMEASSLPEALFRLAAPLVAAWLWERGMAIERRRITGRGRIKWRLTPERILVRVGLAETSDRTASEVDAHRRLTRVAKAAKRARALETAGVRKGKRRRALARLDRALERAVEHAQLASDEGRMRAMLDQIGSLYSSAGLLVLPEIAPWSTLDHPLTAGYVAPSTPSTPPPLEGPDKPSGVPADVPDALAAPPAPTPPPGLAYVPAPDDLYPVAVDRYAEEITAGTVPALGQIKTDLRVGQDRAKRIQVYLTELARTRSRTWPQAQATAATFCEPRTVNGSATHLADDIEMTVVGGDA